MFKISTDDLSVAGGLLLLVIALSIVIHGHMSSSDAAANEGHIGVVPIASPLLVGPGSIATAVLIVEKYGPLIAAAAVTGAFFLTWLVLRATSLIYRIIGKNGSDAIARIMGVLLAAYATGLIREGIVNIVRAACKVTGH
jgi:multiple antibiotic resistance protein